MGSARSDGWLHSVMAGTCRPVEPRFCVGDDVDVLRACRLPNVEEVIATGRIERMSHSTSGEMLHWVSGVKTAKTVREIRLVRRVGRPFEGKTLAEQWAEEDEERRGGE